MNDIEQNLAEREEVRERANRLVDVNLRLAVVPSGEIAHGTPGHWCASDPSSLDGVAQIVAGDAFDTLGAGPQHAALVSDMRADGCDSPLRWCLWPGLRRHADPLEGLSDADRASRLAEARAQLADPDWRERWRAELSETVGELVAG